MIEIVKLQNGARVVHEYMPYVRSASVGLFVLNGSRNERGAESGVSHFIEHMMFKGTETRTAADIADEMDTVGGQLNAYTGKDYTCYYAKVLDTHVQTALDVLADMFFHSLFDDGEIDKERNVILEEITMVEDTPEDIAHDLLQAAAWKGGPLAKPILGTARSIKRFDGAFLRGYYGRHYTPDKTVISVAGNWPLALALPELEKRFGGGGWGLTEPQAAVRKSYYTPRVYGKEKDTEQLHICVGFPGVDAASDDTYAVAALNTVLGGGMSSRLFQNIREKRGLVYSIYSYATSNADAGLTTVYAGLSPACANEAVPLIIDEIRALAREGVSEALLAKTKEQLKANYLLSLESSASRMSAIGRAALLLNRVYTPDEVIGRIDGVKAARVNELAMETLDTRLACIAAVGRIGGFDLEGWLRDN